MTSPRTRIAESQMVNLWGRSQGELPNEVKLVLIEDTSPQRAKLVFQHSVKTAGIPPEAEVRLYLYHHLRLVRKDFGRFVRTSIRFGGDIQPCVLSTYR